MLCKQAVKLSCIPNSICSQERIFKKFHINFIFKFLNLFTCIKVYNTLQKKKKKVFEHDKRKKKKHSNMTKKKKKKNKIFTCTSCLTNKISPRFGIC